MHTPITGIITEKLIIVISSSSTYHAIVYNYATYAQSNQPDPDPE